MRVLVVEDDERVASFVRRGLTQEGFAVDLSHDGRDAFHQALHEPYDAVVLDVLLPFMSGLQVVSELRQNGCSVPVVIVSAKGGVHDRVRGLNSGADDYLAKPFHFIELAARIRALLRRNEAEPRASSIRVADLQMEIPTRRVTRAGQLVQLTPKEFSLLEYLMRNRGNVLTRTMIAQHVWDQHFDSFSNVIDVYIRYLRSKVDDGYDPKLIHTLRGVGYILSQEAP